MPHLHAGTYTNPNAYANTDSNPDSHAHTNAHHGSVCWLCDVMEGRVGFEYFNAQRGDEYNLGRSACGGVLHVRLCVRDGHGEHGLDDPRFANLYVHEA